MKRRKSPIRHRVKAHTREGRPVKSHSRGKGSRSKSLKIRYTKSEEKKMFEKLLKHKREEEREKRQEEITEAGGLDKYLRQELAKIADTVVIEEIKNRQEKEEVLRGTGIKFTRSTKLYWLRDWYDKVGKCSFEYAETCSDKKYVIAQTSKKPIIVCRACLRVLKESEKK